MARKQTTSDPGATRRARIRRRRRGVAGLVLLAIILAAPLLLTRSPLTARLVLPKVEAQLGARVRAARVVIEPDGTIVATDLRILARGVPGPAAEILTAERVEISSTWADLLSGSGAVREMTFVRPRLRVSRDQTSGEINLNALRIAVSESGPSQPLPRVVVRDGAIELGEHGAGEYSELRRLRLEGSMRPTPDAEQLGYAIQFAEGAVSDEGGRGLSLSGRITPAGVTLTLEGLLLGEWKPEHIPGEYREVFEQMRIEGAVPRTAMSIGADGSALFRVELEGVALNLPFDAEGNPAQPDNMVRLREVTGTIEVSDAGADARLTGVLGDLPSSVHLVYGGLTADAPFRCEIETTGFQLRSNPELLPLAPGIVVRRLRDFSNPTATVDASVLVERAAPGPDGPGRIDVTGELAFRDGTAAFNEFPYPFHDLEGLATFDDEKIEIVRITARADSGATISATGVIAPPRQGASVDIRVRAESVPVDDMLLEAMGEQRREIVESLFSRERYQQLLDKGLVRRPGEPGEAPELALGGTATVEIRVLREEGPHTGYNEQVRVTLPVAGVVAEPFPFPILARDVLIEIADDQARVVEGSFAGLTGGGAVLEGAVDLSAPDESGVRLSIRAADVPADALLFAAIPGGLDDAAEAQSSASDVLRRLGVHGAIDCAAEVAAREDGQLGYDVDVSFREVSAAPAHGDTGQRIRLSAAAGRLLVSETDLSLRLAAEVRPAGVDAEPGTISVDGTMAVEGEQRLFQAQIGAALPDVSVAIEDLVAALAPEMAARIGEFRRERNPTGGLDLRVHADGALGGDVALDRLDVEVLACRGLEVDVDAGRLAVATSAGSVAISGLGADTAHFDGFEAALALDGVPAATVTLSGAAPLDRAWREGDALDLHLRNARLESPFIRDAVREALPERLATALDEGEVECEFDADLALAGDASKERPIVTGELRPRRSALTLRGQRVTMSSLRGGITLDPMGGAFEGFHAQGEGWWAELDGSWVAAGEGAVLVETSLNAESAGGLTEEVRAMLPEGLRAALEAISLRAAGRLAARKLDLRVSVDEQHGSAYWAEGRVVFADAHAEVGVTVDEASGYLDFSAESIPGYELGNFGLGVILDEARAAGIALRNGALRIASDPAAGIVSVPVIVADAHGGKLSGSAIVNIHADRPATFDADLRLSQAPLGEILADWEHAAGIERAVATEEQAPARPSAESRGLVDAGLRLSGRVGDQASRRGRGTIRIGGGENTEVLRLPLLLPLIQVSNLQIPMNDRLDFGEAVYFLEGDTVVFERIGVFAESVEIFGYGRMELPTMNLDLRFNSRAARRLPVVSEVLERFRNELITTKVEGAIADPDISLVQFAGARQLFAAASGRDLTAEERRMLEIERLSRESARRELRVGRPARAGSGEGILPDG